MNNQRKWTPWCAIISLLLFTGLPAYAEEGGVQGRAGDTETRVYRNETLGFRITIDKDWKFVREDKDSATFEVGAETRQVMICMNQELTADELEEAGKDIEVFGRAVCIGLRKNFPDMKIVSAGKCTVAGSPAYSYTWDSTIQADGGVKVPTRFLQILLIKKQTLCLFQLVAPQKEFPPLVDRVMACFGTFAIDEGSEK
jgi:hypothetical protein